MSKKRSFQFSVIKKFLLQYEGLILLLSFLLLLRIPNLFEPYWYGDEAIYLTVGNGLRHGLRLYAEIIDHKTPLIYYFAMAPSQFWFRMLTISWMIATTILFFHFTKALKFRIRSQYISTFLFVIFTTLPWLEGNIPNGELFVMGFIMLGAWIFSQTNYFRLYIEGKIVPIKEVIAQHQAKLLIAAGVSFSLAILTKVPALFDVAPFFLIGFFTLVDHFSPKRSRKVLFSMFGLWEILSIGVAIPILLSIVYYAFRNSLHSYIDIGLLYNFRYAGNWSLPQQPFGLEVLLSMKAKLAIVASGILLMVPVSKYLSGRTQFIVSWCLLSLFGALLSSRPYPHYLLQVVPAFALLSGLFFHHYKHKLEYVAMSIPFLLLVGAILGIQFGFYSTSKYYTHFFQYLTKQMTKEEYYQSFDSLMKDNYQAASILQLSTQPRIFIWGTNPTLYALSKKVPVGRFTVAFHLPDFPGAFEETSDALQIYEPEFVVVMKNETISFPEFFTFLNMNYIPYKELDHMIIYKKTAILNTDLKQDY